MPAATAARPTKGRPRSGGVQFISSPSAVIGQLGAVVQDKPVRRRGATRVVGNEDSAIKLVLYELSPAERKAVHRRNAKRFHSGRRALAGAAGHQEVPPPPSVPGTPQARNMAGLLGTTRQANAMTRMFSRQSPSPAHPLSDRVLPTHQPPGPSHIPGKTTPRRPGRKPPRVFDLVLHKSEPTPAPSPPTTPRVSGVGSRTRGQASPASAVPDPSGRRPSRDWGFLTAAAENGCVVRPKDVVPSWEAIKLAKDSLNRAENARPSDAQVSGAELAAALETLGSTMGQMVGSGLDGKAVGARCCWVGGLPQSHADEAIIRELFGYDNVQNVIVRPKEVRHAASLRTPTKLSVFERGPPPPPPPIRQSTEITERRVVHRQGNNASWALVVFKTRAAASKAREQGVQLDGGLVELSVRKAAFSAELIRTQSVGLFHVAMAAKHAVHTVAVAGGGSPRPGKPAGLGQQGLVGGTHPISVGLGHQTL